MLTNFWSDLEIGHKAEDIVLNTFSSLTDQYTFENVSNVRECRYKGDIKATAADGREIYIEVKNDSRIADTHNVLCEYMNFYRQSGTYGKGYMDCACDVFCVVSESEQKIYIIDFATLKKYYKYGEAKTIPHAEQTTYCYLLDLGFIKSKGGLIDIVEYS